MGLPLPSATLVLATLVWDTPTASVRLRLSLRPMPTTVLTVLASATATVAWDTPVLDTLGWATPDTATTVRAGKYHSRSSMSLVCQCSHQLRCRTSCCCQEREVLCSS